MATRETLVLGIHIELATSIASGKFISSFSFISKFQNAFIHQIPIRFLMLLKLLIFNPLIVTSYVQLALSYETIVLDIHTELTTKRTCIHSCSKLG